MPGILNKLFGTKSDKDIKLIMPQVNVSLEFDKVISKLSNDELRAKTGEFRSKIAAYILEEEKEIEELRKKVDPTAETELDIDEKERIYKTIDNIDKKITEKIEVILNEILPEAFSVMKETAKRFKENEFVVVTANDNDKNLSATKANVEIRGDKAYYHNQWMAGGNMITWDMVHYDVQLLGGIVLHQGKISEMATGEGKTLVATLPVYLNALPGKGVHLVTVNDYLAKRDSEWMGVLFEFHGLKVDCIDRHEPNSDERKKAYLADITYGTNSEFGFDYLRDNMARNPEEIVQRKHNYAIVDEVDSVLIDDARTPLIISGPTPKGEEHEFFELRPKVEKLYNAQRSLINTVLADAKNLMKIAEGNAENEKKLGEALFKGFRGLPKNKALIKLLSEQGMKALMQKTENFYLGEQEKNMHIIDDQLYFVIDEKNNSINLSEKGYDLFTSSTETADLFILPDIGSQIAELEKIELSPTEKLEKKNELLREYSVKSERVHTIHQLIKAYTLFEKDVEYVVMDNRVMIVDEQTGRILEGRRYSDGLHQAIEAKENVKVEAATQTYATVTLQNYFRMYSKLAGMTGTAETEAGELWDIYKLDVVVVPTNVPMIRQDREDLVYKTKREKYNAVIDEIGKLVEQGRPSLVGTTSVEVSELLSKMLKLRKIKHNVLNAKLHQKEAMIVLEAGIAGTVTIATNMAGRGTDIKLGPGVKDAGGLAILGTERHESRRVDRQLRGRAGRQGDPGSSQFFVSLDDDLMRLFGSERIAKIMDTLGIKEGEVIQHSMITKSIERAQKKIEENNFGIRKRLLEYDDVMNAQREVIYAKRRHALYGERLAVDIANTMYDVCEMIAADALDKNDFDEFKLQLVKVLLIDSPVDAKEFANTSPDKLTEKIFEAVYKNYRLKSELIAKQGFPVVKDIFENSSRHFELVAIPISDGINTMQVLVNLKKAYDTKGKEIWLSIEKGVVLSIIDDAWKEQLREMDDLKQSVQSATYEQKDPLIVYKLESFNLFKQMIQKINTDLISFLVKANLPFQRAEDEAKVKEVEAAEKTDMSNLRAGREDFGADTRQKYQDARMNRTGEQEVTQPIRVEKKVGRNDPCPCGSGKKYKNCHGTNS
jgi:preprotein translocase subunit SecA